MFHGSSLTLLGLRSSQSFGAERQSSSPGHGSQEWASPSDESLLATKRIKWRGRVGSGGGGTEGRRRERKEKKQKEIWFKVVLQCPCNYTSARASCHFTRHACHLWISFALNLCSSYLIFMSQEKRLRALLWLAHDDITCYVTGQGG